MLLLSLVELMNGKHGETRTLVDLIILQESTTKDQYLRYVTYGMIYSQRKNDIIGIEFLAG